MQVRVKYSNKKENVDQNLVNCRKKQENFVFVKVRFRRSIAEKLEIL